jgi:hypothetical protein
MSVAAVSVHAPAGSGRGTLLLILALFVLPVLIAGGLYVLGWRPDRTMNTGELIQPTFVLPEVTDVGGKPLAGERLRHKWLLLVTGSGPCDASCADLLHQVHSVQIALNKERDRIRRAWVNPSAGSDPALPELRRSLPDLLVAQPADAAWAAAFGSAPGHRLYVADPMGNVILRYAEGTDPRGVRKDLERLLKYSWIG